MINFGKIALLLLLCATTVGGFVWLPPAVGFQNPALARIFVFHTPCAMAGYLASGVAIWYAVRYLAWTRDLGDDIKSKCALSLALLFWTLTTVTGAIFAKAQWGQYWNWDPRETAMFLLLLVCLAYFALRAAIDAPARRATLSAAYAVFAIIAVPFLSYVLPNQSDSLHPKGVINSRGGLSPEYSLVFWAGTLGLCLVFAWAWRVQVRLETLEWRMRGRAFTAPCDVPVLGAQGN